MRWLLLLAVIVQSAPSDAAMAKEKMLKQYLATNFSGVKKAVTKDRQGQTTITLIGLASKKELTFDKKGVLKETFTKWTGENGEKMLQLSTRKGRKMDTLRIQELPGGLEKIDRYPSDKPGGPQRFGISTKNIGLLAKHVATYVRETGKPAVFAWQNRKHIVVTPDELAGKNDAAAIDHVLQLAGK